MTKVGERARAFARKLWVGGVGAIVATRRNRALTRRLATGKRGLEIGGPSGMFAATGPVPVYPFVASLDNTNFSGVTVWQPAIEEGLTYRYAPGRPAGRQYLCDATDLGAIASASYDLLLSSHTLEHVANPLKALAEWGRVVTPGGTLVVVLPHRVGAFDHRRDVTPLAHMVDDFRRETKEDDLTHLEEILARHDLSRDPPAGDHEAFRRRSLENLHNRCLHHHVFDTRSAVALFDQAGLQLLAVEAIAPNSILLVAETLPRGREKDNDRFLARGADFLRHSPFAADRRS